MYFEYKYFSVWILISDQKLYAFIAELFILYPLIIQIILSAGNSAKQRLKFSIRPVKPSFFGKGTSSLVDDSSQKVSLAQRFDALVKSDKSSQHSKQLPMVESLQGRLSPNLSHKVCSFCIILIDFSLFYVKYLLILILD